MKMMRNTSRSPSDRNSDRMNCSYGSTSECTASGAEFDDEVHEPRVRLTSVLVSPAKVITPVDEISGSITRVIRADPKRRGLLFAGTESGVRVSFDDGDHWQSLKQNMPDAPCWDLTIKDNDLIVGTYGRGIWVLDNAALLRQLTPGMETAKARLFAPSDAVRVRRNVGDDTPLPPEIPHARLVLENAWAREILPGDGYERWSDRLRNVELVAITLKGDIELDKPAYAGSFHINSLFVSGPIRNAVAEGRADFIPAPPPSQARIWAGQIIACGPAIDPVGEGSTQTPGTPA